MRLRAVAAVAALAAGALALVLAARGSHRPGAPDVVAVAVGRGTAAADVATGFAAGPGRVVTVAHVLAAGATVTVDGRRAHVVRVDAARDLAVLAVASGRERAARTGTATGPVRLLVRRGARVRALAARVRRRIAARVEDPAGGPAVARPALELEADVGAGDSGAPVLGPGGRIVGVLFARSDRRPRTAYAVDATALRALLDEAG